jgi:hypothetical protein
MGSAAISDFRQQRWFGNSSNLSLRYFTFFCHIWGKIANLCIEDATSPSTASVVSLINGIDAATYVADFAYTASFNRDADAAYNTMFFEKAFVAGAISKGYFSGGGRVRYVKMVCPTSVD